MVSLAEVLEGYRVVELSHVLEEGMPRPQVPYGHIPWKSFERGDAFNTFMVLVLENAANLGVLPPRGAYFVGLPLRVRGGTGFPVRAVAFVPRG